MGNVGGFAPAGILHEAPGTYRMLFGKRAFFGYVVAPDERVWWFANPPTPYPEHPDRDWLVALFTDDAGPAVPLILGTPGDLLFSDQLELPRVPVWRRGPMIVVGDAAHAASPTSGQGAALAAEDGLALARCLRDLPVSGALAAFEAQRRARVERVVAEAARTSATKVPGPAARFIRDLILPIVLAAATRSSRDWLFDYRIPWEDRVAP